MSNAHDIVSWIILSVLIVIPISAAIRLVVAAFSSSVRHSVREHPIAHATWFVGGILSLLFFVIACPIIKNYAHRHADRVNMEAAQHAQAQADKQAFLDGVEQAARDEIRQGAPESAMIDETVILFRQKGATESEIDAVKKRLSTTATEIK